MARRSVLEVTRPRDYRRPRVGPIPAAKPTLALIAALRARLTAVKKQVEAACEQADTLKAFKEELRYCTCL